VIEFRADQVGTFDFYSNMTSDARHSKMRGQLTVRRR
jgi:heme/copper-type cytochrome/quinol oxidase subunit 2